MGVSGPKDIISALGLRSTRGKLYQYARETAIDIGQIGEEEGKVAILTSPTERDWSEKYYKNNPRRLAAARKRTGRVDTGQMLNDFTHTVTKVGSGYAIEIGWVKGDPDGYYEDQEQGFVWTMGSKAGGIQLDVPGMFALDKSQEAMHRQARALLARMKRRLEA